MVSVKPRVDSVPALPDDVPVTMPELPPRLVIMTAGQFKAIAEPTRSRILGMIQNQPATAKQIADRLGIAPGAAGHHMQVLEAAGLAQVVAKRIIRGIIAKYYARTARIFSYDISPDVTGGISPSIEIMATAANEFAETVAEADAESRCGGISFPHARLSPECAKVYAARLEAIVEDLLHEPQDPTGEVYGLFTAMFRSPSYMQSAPPSPPGDQATDNPREGEDA